MSDDHALRQTAASRGVYHVGGRLGRGEVDFREFPVGDGVRPDVGGIDDDAQPGITDDVAAALGRQLGIDGHIGCTSSQHGQRRDKKLAARRGVDPHERGFFFFFSGR